MEKLDFTQILASELLSDSFINTLQKLKDIKLLITSKYQLKILLENGDKALNQIIEIRNDLIKTYGIENPDKPGEFSINKDVSKENQEAFAREYTELLNTPYSTGMMAQIVLPESENVLTYNELVLIERFIKVA